MIKGQVKIYFYNKNLTIDKGFFGRKIILFFQYQYRNMGISKITIYHEFSIGPFDK